MNIHQTKELAQSLDNALPQTQCTKCGYPDCRAYAEAMAAGETKPNRCPPGGAEGIVRLSNILASTYPQDEALNLTIDPNCGVERPRSIALIDPRKCIGCTLCIQACPVDAIVGASKQMHIVLPEWCTGCDLCIPPCPVDCISMLNVTDQKTGWNAWSPELAHKARTRYHTRNLRLDREERDNHDRLARKAASKLNAINAEIPASDEEQKERERKRAIIAAAIERAEKAKAAKTQ